MKTITTSINAKLKPMLFFLVCTLVFTTMQAQNLTATAQGILDFESEVIDYGTIKKNANGERTFTFTNSGNAPIIITNVKTSCGCTVPTKPNGPIMPGEMAQIGVKYATNRIGAFSKTITVLSNATTPSKVLKIKGTVVDAENKLGE